MTNLELALSFVEKEGAKVFPSRFIPDPNDSKKGLHVPYIKYGTESSSDPAVITAWAAKYPGCYFGIYLKESGMSVLDVDDKKGKRGREALAKLEEEHGKLPETLQAETPSVGDHYLWRGVCAITSGKLGSGLDTPIMIPIPGSAVGNKGEYKVVSNGAGIADLPGWILEKAGAPSERIDREEEPTIELDLPHNVEEAIRYLSEEAPEATQGDGGDRTTLEVAWEVRDWGISEDQCLELMSEEWNDQKASPPWYWGDLAEKVGNAYTYYNRKIGNKTSEFVWGPRVEELDIGIDVEAGLATVGKYDAQKMMDLCLLTGDFMKLKLPPKIKYLDPWLFSQWIILITGDRGTGKTRFIMSVLNAVSGGAESFGPWDVLEHCPCLMYDAELVPQDIQGILAGLKREGASERLYVLSDAILVEQGGLPKGNLQSTDWRAAMKSILLRLGVKVWALDNIASASTGATDENSSADWRDINGWLLDLRYAGITTILMHHTNKGGEQRGTHAREDNIDGSMLLRRPKGYSITDGAAFDIDFSKARLPNEDLKKINDVSFKLLTGPFGEAIWEVGKPKQDQMAEILRLVDAGLNQKDTATELGCTPQYISKQISKAKKDGLLTSSGTLTARGLTLLE